MNIVKYPDKGKTIEPGDLFKSISGSIYILAHLDNNKYAAINLATGKRWGEQSYLRHDSIKGLEFYKRNAEITIE